ncbi:MAG TPA: alpha/beta hydrolase [Bradyrhizobium sp.]|jgi:pimeloyl-ACP methyl ester carboxylesterase
MFPDLGRIQCPTLALGGEDDPMIPIECQADIAAALPPQLVQSNDLRIAGTPWSPMRLNAPSR